MDNIQTLTGKSPDDLKKLASEKGFLENGELKTDIKAGQIVKWLKDDFDLGHGHSMAIWALLKGKKS